MDQSGEGLVHQQHQKLNCRRTKAAIQRLDLREIGNTVSWVPVPAWE